VNLISPVLLSFLNAIYNFVNLGFIISSLRRLSTYVKISFVLLPSSAYADMVKPCCLARRRRGPQRLGEQNSAENNRCRNSLPVVLIKGSL
jgi:hypothetical protein